jgi:hypothetical protein
LNEQQTVALEHLCETLTVGNERFQRDYIVQALPQDKVRNMPSHFGVELYLADEADPDLGSQFRVSPKQLGQRSQEGLRRPPFAERADVCDGETRTVVRGSVAQTRKVILIISIVDNHRFLRELAAAIAQD